MILVVGGTGTLGTRIVRLLSDRQAPVRVLTRDARRARHLAGPNVQAVLGDVRDPVAAASAVRSCQTVISAVHGFAGPGRPSPESVDRDGNRALTRAAAAAGVSRFILVSVLGAAPDHPMSLHRMKHAAEQELMASGLGWTIVRPAAFLETWIGVIGGRLSGTGPAIVLGPGNNPINFVSAAYVARLVDLAVRDPRLRGQIIGAGGPENLSFTQVAERLIAGTGRPGRIRRIPLPDLRALSVPARPVSPAFARQAQAAVIMNTTDMTSGAPALAARFPAITATTLDSSSPASQSGTGPGQSGQKINQRRRRVRPGDRDAEGLCA